MCGIFGIYSFISNLQNIRSAVASGLRYVSSRGPDGNGVFGAEFMTAKFCIGHTRLSVIDLSDDARQPMSDDTSEWVIAYNGEIYNFREIRQELIQNDYIFNSQSDTEVLLKSWAQWGMAALDRLNGMFAFVAFNRKTGEVWLVRDRFGVKPLAWGRTPDGGVVFSSSIAAVAQVLSAPVDTDYCSFGLRFKAFEGPNAETPFSKVNSVAPGGWLKVQIEKTADGETQTLKITQGRWYDLAQAVAAKHSSIAHFSDNDLLAHCQDILQDAVRLRLRSDVLVAVSLSGGLDSSAVAALAASQVPDLHGFTYGAADAHQSEGPTVARFAKHANITPHFIWPKLNATGLDGLLERTLICQEAPFPGLAVMAQNEVFRTVRDAGFKVLLGGQGGDEIFAGYRKFFVVAMRHTFHARDPRGSMRLLYSLGLMLLHEAGAARTYWRALSRYGTRHDIDFTLLDWSTRTANLWGAPNGSLTDRQIEDVQRWSIPTLLRYEDRNSMGHGVETRLPFMDYRLVELALAMPARLKISNGYGKWAVRQVTKGIVPDFVRLNRKKRGFDVTQSWIADGLGASLRCRINDNKASLQPHMKSGVNIDKCLSDTALQANSNLLDEALMLAWLAQPIRNPPVTEAVA